MRLPTAERRRTAPAADAAESQSGYYTTDISRLTFAELRRITAPNKLAFLLVAGAKVVRRPWRTGLALAYESVRIAELTDVPPKQLEILAGPLGGCERAGFTRRFALAVPMLGDQEGVNVVHVNRDRTVLACAIYIRALANRHASVTLQSKLADGFVMATSNARRQMNAPPEFLSEHLPGARVVDLAERHRIRLRDQGTSQSQVLDDVAQRQFLLDNAQRSFEFQRDRGIFVPLTREEVARLRTASPGEQ